MTDKDIEVIVQNGKHYIVDFEADNVVCVEDTLALVDFENKRMRGELTGTLKVNRILRNFTNKCT